MLKTISQHVLANGGIIRSFENLGDRVLVKNLRSKDGLRYSVGRFIQLHLDVSPNLLQSTMEQARENNEVLRVNTNKIKDADYFDRAMKRINQEMSPFRDKSSFDEDYVRAMWTKYSLINIKPSYDHHS